MLQIQPFNLQSVHCDFHFISFINFHFKNAIIVLLQTKSLRFLCQSLNYFCYVLTSYLDSTHVEVYLILSSKHQHNLDQSYCGLSASGICFEIFLLCYVLQQLEASSLSQQLHLNLYFVIHLSSILFQAIDHEILIFCLTFVL